MDWSRVGVDAYVTVVGMVNLLIYGLSIGITLLALAYLARKFNLL